MQGPTGKKEHMQAPIKNITVGLEHVFNVLTSKLSPTVRDEVKAVGHRLVHGGQLASSVVLDDNAKAELQRAATFAPLHNPAQLAAVQDCESFFDDRTQVRVRMHLYIGDLSFVLSMYCTRRKGISEVSVHSGWSV